MMARTQPVVERLKQDSGVTDKKSDAARTRKPKKLHARSKPEQINEALDGLAAVYPENCIEFDIELAKIATVAKKQGINKSSLMDRIKQARKQIADEKRRIEREAEQAEAGSNLADVVKKAAGEQLGKILEELNEHYAVVRMGGSVKIMAPDVIDPYSVPDFMSRDDFNFLMAPVKAMNKDGEAVPVAPIWAQWKDRRTYHKVDFLPYGYGREPDASPHVLNLFRGWPIEPVKGDWSLMRRHIFWNLCRGNPEWFAYCMMWWKDLIIDPGTKKGVATGVRGLKGTGKSFVPDQFGKLLPPKTYVVAANENDIYGEFNKHLGMCLLLNMEEAFYGASLKQDGIIKNLITASQILVNQKFVDKVPLTSSTRVWVNSNVDHVFQATEDERRWFALETADTNRKDISFFKAIDEQMAAGGLAALMYDLVYGFAQPKWIDLRNPPRTPWLGQQVEHSFKPFERWWLLALAEGGFETDTGSTVKIEADSGVVFPSTLAFEAFRHYCEKRRGQYRNPDKLEFDRYMRGKGGISDQIRVPDALKPFVKSDRAQFWSFNKTLKDLKEEFEERSGVKVNPQNVPDDSYASMYDRSLPAEEIDWWRQWGGSPVQRMSPET